MFFAVVGKCTDIRTALPHVCCALCKYNVLFKLCFCLCLLYFSSSKVCDSDADKMFSF